MKLSKYELREVRKALAGGIAAVLPLLAADLADLHISRPEGGGLVGAFILGAGVVFKIKNHTAAPTPPEGD